MIDTEWIAEHAPELARATVWPLWKWTEALEPVSERPDRDDWIAFLRSTYVNPERIPSMLAVTDAYTEVARSDAAKVPDVVADLEQMARATRRRLGLPADAPLTIELGADAAKCIADIAAAEASAWLDSIQGDP